MRELRVQLCVFMCILCVLEGQVVPAATKDEGKTSETNSSCCKYNTDKELKFAVRTGNDSTWTVSHVPVKACLIPSLFYSFC